MRGPQHGDDDRGTHLGGVDREHLAATAPERTTHRNGMPAPQCAMQKNSVDHCIGGDGEKQRADAPGGTDQRVNSVWSLRWRKCEVHDGCTETGHA